MARLKKPKVKEVSLAKYPANNKKFLFVKEDEMQKEAENEDILSKMNEDLNKILGIKKEQDEFEKSANPLTVVSKKIEKLKTLNDSKSTVDKATIKGILEILNKIVVILKNSKVSYGYGYPAPKKNEGEVKKEKTDTKENEEASEEDKILEILQEVL